MTINYCFKDRRGNGLQSILPFHGLINSLRSSATAALVVIYSPLTSAVEPLVYSTTVNHAEQTAIFQIKLDSKPDFFTVDEHFRQADSMQFWVDASAPNPIGRAYEAIFGDIPADSQNVISFREIPTTNRLEVIWVKPNWDPVSTDSGGWGSVVGTAPYSLAANNVLSFELPLSLLRDDDGVFYYSFFTTKYGGTSSSFYDGVSGVTYIPEPEISALLLAGLALVGLMSRRKKSEGRV